MSWIQRRDFNRFLEDKKQMENWRLMGESRSSLDFRHRILEPRRQMTCLAEPYKCSGF